MTRGGVGVYKECKVRYYGWNGTTTRWVLALRSGRCAGAQGKEEVDGTQRKTWRVWG